VRFCLAWLVPGWLLFEAVPTKLPHYILPLLPAAALLLGAVIDDQPRLQTLMRHRGGIVWRALWGALSLGLAGGIIWFAQNYRLDGMASGWAWIAGAVVIAAVVAATLIARATGNTIGAFVVIGALFGAITVGQIAPTLDRLWVSLRLAAAVAQTTTTEPVILVGFHEPSAIFLLGTATRLTDATSASALLLSHPGMIAAVDAPHLPAVTARVEAAGYKVVTLDTIEGDNYARGKSVALTLITSTAP